MFSLIVASQLKKGRFETTVLSDERDVYCRCTSPYVLTGEAELSDAIQPECMFAEYGLNIVHDKALSIDTAKRQVIGASGERYGYDYLAVATGASPYVPSIRGVDSDRVHTVRTSEDIEAIWKEAGHARKSVVIGAGIIGIEVAGALRGRGMDVSLVESAETISSDIADAEFAEKILSHLRESGIRTTFGGKATEIRDGSGGRKAVVVSKDGAEEIFEADMVVIAAGVHPNLSVIDGSGIRSTERGIVVDDRMRTNIRNVYACGDCCVPLSGVTGEYHPSPLASSAIQQAKIVGYQIAGFPIRYAGSTGAFAFQTLGKEYAGVGLTEDAARRRYHRVVVGRAETTDVYKDLKSVRSLSVKLVFAGLRMRLVGYEAFGNGVIASAEVASFAIGGRTGILKMLRFNYIAHPSMTAWPFMNPIIMATEDAIGSVMSSVRKYLPFV